MWAHPTVIGRGWVLTVLLGFPFVVSAMRRRGSASGGRIALAGLSFLYVVAVLAVTIFPIFVAPPAWRADEHWWEMLRLIPFWVPPIGFVLNIVMFLPFGVLLPLLWPATGTRRRMFWWGLAASATIELSQFAMWVTLGNRRMVDVNDLMSNTAGAVLGLMLLRVFVPAGQDWDEPALTTSTRP